MARFLKENGPLAVAVGAGIVIGAGGTAICYSLSKNLNREVTQIASNLERLSKEVKDLRNTVESVAQSKRKRAMGYYSVHASSGEDEDEYEEALDVDSLRREFDTLRSQNTRTETASHISSQNGSIPSDLTKVFAKVDKLLEGNDQDREQAYTLLQDKLKKNDSNAELLWRLAKATTFVAQIKNASGNKEGKKQLTYDALDVAKSALESGDHIANVHKWYAITLGNIGDFEGTSAKIQNGYQFKEHIEKAIQLNPKDPSSHYLLGRWCFGVYMLSWIEKKAAATLYATPPTSTVEEALIHFVQAEKLNPGKWKDNMLYIAKCHLEKRDYYKAVEWLDKAEAVPIVGQDDRTAQIEIDGLLYKYAGYRV